MKRKTKVDKKTEDYTNLAQIHCKLKIIVLMAVFFMENKSQK